MGGAVGRRLVSVVVGVLAVVLIAPHASALSIVQRIDHTSTSDYTRVVVTLSGQTAYRIFTLPADPDRQLPVRLSIDFSPARLGEVAGSVPINDGLLMRVRTGQFSATTVRVVLDIAAVDDYKAFPLYSPYRVVLDVRGTAAEPSVRATHRPSLPRYHIMLDPGHGGHDPGARSAGSQEKDIVLAVSKRLGKKLAQRLPVEVSYTRLTDVFISLPDRTARANAAKADLFVSIHANASTNPEAHGIETYYLNNTNDRATIRLAALENGLRDVQPVRAGGAGLSFILSDLIQSGKEDDSITLAHQLQNATVARLAKRYSHVRDIGVKKGPFYVLVGAHMPCVLVEVSFLTHRREGRLLSSPTYQNEIAEGLYEGIARYFRSGPHINGL